MTTSKSLTAAIAAAAMVGVIGLAYAQTSTDSTTPQAQEPNRTAAMGTNSETNIGKTRDNSQGTTPSTTPSTLPSTTPSTTPMGSDTSTMSPNSTVTSPNTGASSTMSNGMNGTNANADPSANMTERAARTDRN